MAGGGALAQGGAPSGALDPAEFEYVRGLGVYAEGRGDADELAEAAQAFRNAARAGHPAARRHLAVMYEIGRASCRDKGWQCVYSLVGAVALKIKFIL